LFIVFEYDSVSGSECENKRKTIKTPKPKTPKSKLKRTPKSKRRTPRKDASEEEEEEEEDIYPEWAHGFKLKEWTPTIWGQWLGLVDNHWLLWRQQSIPNVKLARHFFKFSSTGTEWVNLIGGQTWYYRAVWLPLYFYKVPEKQNRNKLKNKPIGLISRKLGISKIVPSVTAIGKGVCCIYIYFST